jgi:hypothetical protein
LGLFDILSTRLPFAIWSIRISDLPGPATPIGFVFSPARVFGPQTAQIGFVWRSADMGGPPPASAIALAQIIDNP